MKIVILDVETTGTNPETDTLLEIGGAVIDTENDVYAPLQFPFRIIIVPTEDLKGPISLNVLAMHSLNGLWAEIKAANDEMLKDKAATKVVLQNAERGFAVRPSKVSVILEQMMRPIMNGVSTKKACLGGKNVEFDLSFLRKIDDKRIDQYFIARKFDPAVLWLQENDQRPPSLDECYIRTINMFGPPEESAGQAHNSLNDCRMTAWAIRGGLRRLGLYTPLDYK